MSEAHPQRNSRRIFGAILLFGLLAMTARNATDPDLWWHLRTGEWMAEHHQVPRTDPFSFTRADAAWVSHEWLSEIILYGIWRWTGWAGLIVFSALITSAGFMVLYARCPARPSSAAAATALGAVAAAPAWGVRPQMFTFLLASVLLWLLERSEQRPRCLLWIPLLFLPWINLHAGYALGPALLLAYALGLLWETATGATPWEANRGPFTRVLLIVGACIALVPFNPNGTTLYRYPIDVLRSEGMKTLIVEWFSPDFHLGRYLAFLLMLIALFAILSTSRMKLKARVLFPLFGTMLGALDAVRHIPIFVLIAVPVLAAAVPEASRTRAAAFPTRRTWTRLRLRRAFEGSAVLLMAVFALVRWTGLVRNQPQAEAASFPHAAVEFLHSHSLPERLFAYYDWGGYAIWKLYPGYRVFVDGRADLYGDALLEDFKTEVKLGKKWRTILDRWNVGTVLVPRSCALAQALSLESSAADERGHGSGWEVVYSDPQAIVIRRRNGFEGTPVAAGFQPVRRSYLFVGKVEKIPRTETTNLRN